MSAARQDAKYRIADAIRSKIVSGDYAAGAVVPSETQLAQEFGVAKMTARGALEVLKAEGLLEARQGRATRVREFKPIRRRANSRLSAEVWLAGRSILSADVPGRHPEVDQVEVSEGPAPEHIAQALGLSEGELVCMRSRRHVLDGRPVLVAKSYLPAALVAGTAITRADTGAGGIYARLAEIGKKPEHFVEELRFRMATIEETARLNLATGNPVIHIVRTAYTADKNVVELNEMILDANAHILEYAFDA